MADNTTQTVAHEWVSFPGGELEGQRPRALCPACRETLSAQAAGGEARQRQLRSGGTLCFQCYRANLDRERALRQAGDLDTSSDARFQQQLPFEPINEGRLAMLKQERAALHGETLHGETLGGDTLRGAVLNAADRFADRRRRAQMAARRALQALVAARPSSREARGATSIASAAYDRTIAAALHAAELQLPDSWMPFVVAR